MICRHWWMKRLMNFQNWKSIFVYSNTRKLSSIYAGSQKGLVKLFESGILICWNTCRQNWVSLRIVLGNSACRFKAINLMNVSLKTTGDIGIWFKKKELWIDWKKVEHTPIRKENKNESEIDFISWNVLPSTGFFASTRWNLQYYSNFLLSFG